MKKTILSSLFLISVITVNAQGFEWAKGMGGSSIDEGYSITTDAAGNVYTTGSFSGTVDFDPGSGIFNLTSTGDRDIFIQKLDGAGNFLWAKRMGGTGWDEGKSITTDAVGNLFTTGYFISTVDFDPGSGTFNLSSAGGRDIFIQKLDAAGNFLWAKRIGGTEGWDIGYAITTDTAGNVYTTGEFSGTVDFDPGVGTFNLSTVNLSSSVDNDIFIQKLDGSGNFLWAKRMGGSSYDEGYSITTDAAGNVYTTGLFKGTVDFNPGAGTFYLTSASSGYPDIFIQKLDAAGNFLWAKGMGGSTHDRGWSITTDAAGNVYTTGDFRGTIDFDPGSGNFNLSSAGNGDIFIQKLDGSGNFLWAKRMGGSGGDLGWSTTTDAAGNVYTTGYFSGTVDFDPGAGTFNLISAGSGDVFIQKLDGSGNFLWAKGMGGSSYDEGRSITTDSAGNVYTTGYFEGTIDFDPGAETFNLSSAGSVDIFVHKLGACSNTGTDVQTACGSYTWIDGTTYTTSNNTATHTLTNAAGCDSVVTLNLTINNPSTGIDAQTACGSYTWIDGTTYTASNNTATHTLTNAAGCDSVVTLNLTINSPSVGTDVQTACGSYTWIDGNTYTVSNNTATHTLTNAAGCDSVVTLNLTINNPSAGTDVQIACGSYTWIDGNTYTASNNTATHTLTNAAGCDSVVTLNLTINNPSAGTDVQTACGSYTWIDGNTYTASNNTAMHTLTNAAGCDSVVTLSLTINSPSTSTDVQTACGSYTWIDGNTYTASNNMATHTLTNASGCDSVVTLNLTINTLDVSVVNNDPTIVANASGVSYQWINCSDNSIISGETNQSFSASSNGDYAVIISDGSCSDTSDCFTVTTVGVESLLMENSIVVYPNPSENGLFTVDLSEINETVYQVYLINSLGQVIMNRFKPIEGQLSIDAIEAGVYLLVVELNGGGQHTIRLVSM